MIEITATRGWRSLGFRELLAYRELLGIFVWRDIKVRYRQTLLGIVWVVGQPLLTMLFFTFLFNRVAGLSSGEIPYSIFILSALVPWTFFSTAVATSGNSLIGSAHLISKVYFPRMIVPAAAVAGAAVDMFVTFVLTLVLLVAMGIGVGLQVLLLPLIVLVTAALALGVGFWSSALNVRYRDLRVIVPFLLQLWMYATPVVYPLEALPQWARQIATINPLTSLVDGFRKALLGGTVSWGGLVYASIVAGIVLISGALHFRRSERRFADVL